MLNIKINSKEVVSGDIFVAIRGNTVDGHDYIEEAIKNGAVKIICEKGNYDVETIVVEDTYEYLKNYLVDNYSCKFDDLKFVGVTGTNGKTTTCYLVYQMLNNVGIKTCYIGTLGCFYDDKKIELSNTTPDILELYNLILNAKECGCKVIVMEVSSHSISLERIKGLKYNVCAFTNLTQDHLDYHGSMEEYCNTKVKLISYLKDDGKFIVNVDDFHSKNFMCDKSLSLGEKANDYRLLNYELFNTYTNIKFSYNDEIYEVKSNLIGKFNVYNYLTSLSIVNNLGFDLLDIINVSNEIVAPVGRAEIIKVGNSIAVIDYAHTPDAVSNIISCFKEVTKGRIITLVGCGGDRDSKKRPIMGNIASENSDFVIFTNDNPRTEDEKEIMKEILLGVDKENYIVIYDRRDAIKKGIEMLNDNDSLLILGKGHEEYQIIGREKIHLSDSEEVFKNIKNN